MYWNHRESVYFWTSSSVPCREVYYTLSLSQRVPYQRFYCTHHFLCRYNNFQHDPLSQCNCTPPYSGENGISARSDLNPSNGTYPFGALGHRRHGGTDCKVSLLIILFRLDIVYSNEVQMWLYMHGSTYHTHLQWNVNGHVSYSNSHSSIILLHVAWHCGGLLKW